MPPKPRCASSKKAAAICRTSTEPRRRSMNSAKDPSRVERIKEASAYLRGTLEEGLRAEVTGAISEDDAQLVKFHGMYLQDDRDLRGERTKKKMEKAFAFMIRVRFPGGICSPAQWRTLKGIARDYGNGTVRLTTRQSVQLHGVIKSNLKPALAAIDAALLTTIDAYAQDLGFITILDARGDVAGFNVMVGGGMGMTHGEPDTYPRTGDLLGFCRVEDAVAAAEAVVTVQRDWGDRSNRKHARLKYTIEDHGLGAFRAEVERRTGRPLDPPRAFAFASTGDRYGWTQGEDGRSHLTIFVENGRVRDIPGGPQLLTGLARTAERHDADFRFTANQNLIVANVAPDRREAIYALVAEHGFANGISGLRRNAMACVALPTCGLALAESERYLPDLLTALEVRLDAHGLADDDVVIRMTGCPNGCARPYLAEIALVGKGPGRYNLYLGAAFDGSRMAKLYAEDLDHDGIVKTLDPVLAAYARERKNGEHFGDFTIRAGFVSASGNGQAFHADTGAKRRA